MTALEDYRVPCPNTARTIEKVGQSRVCGRCGGLIVRDTVGREWVKRVLQEYLPGSVRDVAARKHARAHGAPMPYMEHDGTGCALERGQMLSECSGYVRAAAE